MKEFGNDVPEFAIKDTDRDSIFRAFLDETSSPRWERIDSPEPGCGVAMALNEKNPGIVRHFGVAIDRHRFIHTTRKIGSCVARFDDPRWSGSIRGYYKWKG